MRSLCGDLFFRIFRTLYNYFVNSRAVHIGNFELESVPLGNFPRAWNVFSLTSQKEFGDWNTTIPYSSDFVEAFKKAYGYDPVPHFHKLFSDCDGAKKFRLQYFRTLNSLFEKNFIGQLNTYLSARGAALTGHCMAGDTATNQHRWSGRIMPYYRQMGIPGIDHLGRRVFGAQTGKQCQSVCNQMGKIRMLSEMYGCTGGSLTFEDREWIANQQMILGVNLIVPHLSLFSQTGCRKRDFPQNINYQQSWWSLNFYVDVPLARACYAMAQGKYAADILVLHPQESIAMNWYLGIIGNTKAPLSTAVRKRTSKISESFRAFVGQLCGQQLTFDLGDEQMLEENGFVDGKRIGIGQMSYGVLFAERFLRLEWVIVSVPCQKNNKPCRMHIRHG